MSAPTISSVSGDAVVGTSFQDYLKSFWTMMWSGRGLTSEIGSFTGSNTNATLLTTGKDWYGGGYNFDGTAFLNFGDILNIPNGSSYTFACVFKTTATGARPMLARFFQSTSFQGYALRLVNGAVNWILGDGVGFIQSQETTGGWNDGSYHLAIVSGNGSGAVSMWVDNNKSTHTANVNASALAKIFYIGSTQQRTTPNYFNGDIGMVYANIGGGQISDAQATEIYNATHFAIDSAYDLTTVNSSVSATLSTTTTTGETVYVYNREGSDSYAISPPVASKPKVTFTYNSTDYEITPPLYGYESKIIHDWVITNRAGSTTGIYDSGSDYDIYQCRCSFLLPDDEANTLLSLYSSTARGGEVTLTCSDGFFPFTPFRGDGEFTVRLSDLDQSARKIEGRWPISLTLTNVGSFPAYSPPAGYSQGLFSIGAVTGLPYPKQGYQPNITYNINEVSNHGAFYVNSATTDDYKARIDMILCEGNCADVVEKLLSDRSANVTIGGGDNYYIFGREKGDGNFTAFRVNPEISVTHQNHNHFRLATEYKWVS